MSTSEQELKGQIAEMREALRSARASARTGKIVGIVGVLLGLCIVAYYVLSFFRLAGEVAKPEVLAREVGKRIEQMRLGSTVKDAVAKAGPVYLKATGEMLKELGTIEALREQIEVLAEDIRPVADSEFRRVAPQIKQQLMDLRERARDDLQERLEKLVGDRLATLVGQAEGQLAESTKLDAQTFAQLIANLQDATMAGMHKVLSQRVGGVVDEINKVGEIVLRLPKLPKTERKDMLLDMRNVLVALLKEKLPAYKGQLPSASSAPPITAREAQQLGEAAAAADAARARAAKAAVGQ